MKGDVEYRGEESWVESKEFEIINYGKEYKQ